ncbi:MAG: HU family DNA-binding protein [Holosporales bacterium]|jgi:DNA-binding protein HU-beta|nr:HU family DNA-binding protein [Holosporales bacterium]
MNKGELVAAVAEATGAKKVDCEDILGAIIDVIYNTLKKGGDVRLVGFGTFSVAQRKESIGRNPSNGAEIKIPACKVPKFKAGQTLKDVVNGGK